MKLEGINTFVLVAATGSLSEAARRLRVSRSVVSERLSELERSLGASLLQRSTRKVTVTEDGAAFLVRAARQTSWKVTAASSTATVAALTGVSTARAGPTWYRGGPCWC